MKKLLLTILAATATTGLMAHDVACIPNATDEIPLVVCVDRWQKVEDVAEYGRADWSNAICRVEGVSLDEAKRIAEQDPNINYFFYVKGWQMVLVNPEVSPPAIRIFHHGDAVFFTGEPTWGEANGLADGYVKQWFND